MDTVGEAVLSLGSMCGATLLGAAVFTSPYFEPRFLVPVVPSLATSIALLLPPLPRPLAFCLALGTIAGLSSSINTAVTAPRTQTDWRLSDDLSDWTAHGKTVKLAVVGSTPDNNVYKLRLFAELSKNPDRIVVLALDSLDLSSSLERLEAVDLVAVVPVSQSLLAEMPRLNRSYPELKRWIEQSPMFAPRPQIDDVDLYWFARVPAHADTPSWVRSGMLP
jgi:hypothetical protein